MDTWINLRFFETNDERNRGISVIKSRGMEHSNQIRELLLTDHGIEIRDVYVGPSGGLLMGSLRASQEVKDLAETLANSQEVARKKREMENKLKSLNSQIDALQSEFKIQEELSRLISEDETRSTTLARDKGAMARLRGADKP